MAKKKGVTKKIIFGILGTIVLFIVILIINLVIFEKKSLVVSKGIPIQTIDDIHPALLVVDIQEATTGKVSLTPHYIDESEELIQHINQIAASFKQLSLPVIYVRSEITNPLINLLNSSYAKGSLGSKLDQRLNVLSPIEVVKSRNDAFINTTLDEILTGNQINELYIVGLDAAHCLNITVQAAQNRNYNICLIKEAILSESIEMKDSMFVEFEKRGVELLSMDNLGLANSDEAN